MLRLCQSVQKMKFPSRLKHSLQFIERIQAGYVDISNNKLDSYACGEQELFVHITAAQLKIG